MRIFISNYFPMRTICSGLETAKALVILGISVPLLSQLLNCRIQLWSVALNFLCSCLNVKKGLISKHYRQNVDPTEINEA